MLGLFTVIFLLVAPLGTKGSLATGGGVCSYTLRFRKHNESLPLEGIPAFVASLVINATGFFNTAYAYNPAYDGEDGTCALPGSFREISVLNFSFTYEAIEYSRENGGILYSGPWFQHYPIGVRYSDIQRNRIVEDYFSRFYFITADYTLFPCYDELPDYCVCDEAGSRICLERATAISCIDNPIPFVSDTYVTFFADNTMASGGTNGDWYYLGEITLTGETDLFRSVYQAPSTPVEYRTYTGNVVDLTSTMCGEADCYYFRSTPGGGKKASAQLNLYMGPGLGQAQRLQIQIGYWSLPNNNGPVCVYFDYSRIDMLVDSEPARPVLNKIWCGTLEPYEAGPSDLTIDIPLTYGPSYDGISLNRLDSNGYKKINISDADLCLHVVI